MDDTRRVQAAQMSVEALERILISLNFGDFSCIINELVEMEDRIDKLNKISHYHDDEGPQP